MVIGSFALMFAASVSFSTPAALMQTRESMRGSEPDSIVVLRGELQRVTLTQQSLFRDLRVASAAMRRAGTETEKAAFRQRVEELSSRLQRSLSDADMLKEHLKAMCDERPAPDGYLGITISETMTVTGSGSATALVFKKYPTLVSMEPGSPAQKAGLLSGDEILGMGGRDMVSGAFDIGALLKPGVQLPVRIRRSGEIRTISVLIEPRPQGFNSNCAWIEVDPTPMIAARPPKIRMFALPNGGFGYEFADSTAPRVLEKVATARGMPVLPPTAHVPARLQATISGSATVVSLGALLLPLSEDLREGLGLDEGILVVDVLRGSPALEAGLRAGDIITRVNGQKLQSVMALAAALDEARDREVELSVRRSGKARTVRLRDR